MTKPKPTVVPHIKPKLDWLILKGRRRMNITPWCWIMPDLKYFKKHYGVK